MKTITHYFTLTRAMLGAVALGLLFASTGQLKADQFRHDDHGYWDNHHVYHHWDYYQNHRGYWDTSSGFRVFINLD